MATNLSLNKLPWYGQVLVVVAIAVAGGVAFWLYVATPARESITERQQKLATMRSDLERGRATARRLPEFRRKAAALDIELEGLQRQLPSDQDVADLLRRVQAMATESNLTIRAFTPQPVARREMHAEWPFQLQLEGTYHHLGGFLERVSKFPRIINVGTIKVQAREAQTASATVAIDATAMTFVLLDTPAKGAKPAKGKAAKGE